MQRRSIADIGISKIITGAIIVALAVGAVVFYLFYTGRFGGGSRLRLTATTHVGHDWSDIAADNNIVSDYLFGRSKNLLVAKGGDGILVSTTYTIAGRLVTQEAENSGIYELTDQALLLKCYVRSGDRANAVSLKNEVINRFRLADGAYKTFVYADEDKNNEEIITVAASVEWLDAMMEYYVTYGNNDDYKEICHLAGILFDSEGRLLPEQISVAKYAESLYVSLEDISDIDATQEGSLEQMYGTLTGDTEGADTQIDELEEEVEGVLLSNINLRLIRDLENNSILPQGSYDRALQSVKDGFAGAGYAFYAYAVTGSMDSGDYIYSGRSTGSFDIVHNVRTMRNLAEVGELDGESFAEFKSMVMNNGRIYTSYVIMTGNYSGREALNAYADGLLLAYFMGDTNLYDRLAGTLGMRVATKSTSPALYMIFREENDRYVFYSRENLSTRLVTS